MNLALRAAPAAVAGLVALAIVAGVGPVTPPTDSVDASPPVDSVTTATATDDAATDDGAPSAGDPATASGTPAVTVPLRSGLLADAARPELPARPARLKIPSLGVGVEVRSVGVDEEQLLDVPSASEAGWYRHGASPGEEGATVIAAHVDYGGVPGAFFSLSALEPGADVIVLDGFGRQHLYEVTSVRLYDKDALPADDLFRLSGEGELHLITCGGTFDHVERTYRGNVVATARPVGV